jgi:hypothetical protein
MLVLIDESRDPGFKPAMGFDGLQIGNFGGGCRLI